MNRTSKALTIAVTLMEGSILGGCSLGTEVGNGLKPSPRPAPSAESPGPDNRDELKNPETVQGEAGKSKRDGKSNDTNTVANSAGSPSNSPESTRTTSQPAQSQKQAQEWVKTLVMNPCVSPWSVGLLSPVSEFEEVPSAMGLGLRWNLRAGAAPGTLVIEWIQPPGGRYTVQKALQGKTAYSIEIRDAANPSIPSTLGADVACSDVRVTSGEFLGASAGPLEEVAANLLLQGKAARIQWYTAPSGTGRTLRLLRITDQSSMVSYDFKPK